MWYLIPLKAIALQLLFLIINSCIKAQILYWKLRVTKQKSLRLSIILNISSSVILWLVFFLLFPFLGGDFELQIINYACFGYFRHNIGATDLSSATWGLTLVGVVVFFSIVLDFVILEFLEWLETDFSTVENGENPINAQLKKKSLIRALQDNDREQIISVLFGNIASYTSNFVFIYLLTLG